MICSGTVQFKCVLLQITFSSCVIENKLSGEITQMADHFPELPESDLNMKTNLVIE